MLTTSWANLQQRGTDVSNSILNRKSLLILSFCQLPSFVFTEEYQTEFLAQYHAVFDEFRKTFFAGEMVWNFADFMTAQSMYIEAFWSAKLFTSC